MNVYLIQRTHDISLQQWIQSQNSDTLESQQNLKEATVLYVDIAPFLLGIYYLLKTNLLVSGSSGFLRASCNISSGLQSHN